MPSHLATFSCVEGLDASPGPARTRANPVEEGIARIRRVDVMEEGLERVPSTLSESPRLLRHRARVARGRMLTHAA